MHLHALLLLCMVCAVLVPESTAQMISGYYVVPSEHMALEQRSYLENKMKTAISSAGLMVTDDYFPMVTAIQYNHLETIVQEGIRRTYKCDGEVTLVVLFDETQTVLGARTFSVSGIGTSQATAQANAVRKISVSPIVLKELYSTAEKNYLAAVNAFAEKRYREGKRSYGQGDYSASIEILSQIPSSTEVYAQAQKLIEAAAKERSAEQKRAEDRVEREKERQHEIRQQAIRETAATQRQIVRSTERVAVERTRANERYHSLWLSLMANR